MADDDHELPDDVDMDEDVENEEEEEGFVQLLGEDGRLIGIPMALFRLFQASFLGGGRAENPPRRNEPADDNTYVWLTPKK